jgi:hypothetical protein
VAPTTAALPALAAMADPYTVDQGSKRSGKSRQGHGLSCWSIWRNVVTSLILTDHCIDGKSSWRDNMSFECF